MSDRLDGTLTRMLRAVLGVSWKEYKTNKELYGKLLKVTESLCVRRLRVIGHSWRRKSLSAKYSCGSQSKVNGREADSATTYVDQLRNDTVLRIEDLKTENNGGS